jgi:hypothetical protein
VSKQGHFHVEACLSLLEALVDRVISQRDHCFRGLLGLWSPKGRECAIACWWLSVWPGGLGSPRGAGV